MGTRNSVQREWIYDYIQRQDAHLSADEIYEGLLKEAILYSSTKIDKLR